MLSILIVLGIVITILSIENNDTIWSISLYVAIHPQLHINSISKIDKIRMLLFANYENTVYNVVMQCLDTIRPFANSSLVDIDRIMELNIISPNI